MDAQKSALIVKFGLIGDVIETIPGVHALHKQGYKIHWLCGNTVRPLLECYSWINLIAVDEKAILMQGGFGRLRNIVRLWRRIGLRRFDLCVILYYDPRYRLLALPIRARRKFALSSRSRATKLIPGRPLIDEYARILTGGEDAYRERSISIVAPDSLPPSPLRGKTAPRRIAIVPGGVKNLVREQATGNLPQQALRRWPMHHYVELTTQLIGRGWEIVLIGGPDDAWVKPHFDHLCIADCIGKLSLPEVISTFNGCDAVITHDTGPLHLAGLSQVALLGLFGPTHPGTVLPRRAYSRAIWGGQNLPCSPCYVGRDFAPCGFNECMHQITPEFVLQELDSLLKARAEGTSSHLQITTPPIPSFPRIQQIAKAISS